MLSPCPSDTHGHQERGLLGSPGVSFGRSIEKFHMDP